MQRQIWNSCAFLGHVHPARTRNSILGHGFYAAYLVNPTCGHVLDVACTKYSTCEHGIDSLLDGPQCVATVSSVLRRLGDAQHHVLGRKVHHHVVECGYGWVFLLANCLMHMYGKCGLVKEAQAIFDRLSNPNTHSWNILMNVYGRNRGLEQAKSVFSRIPSPNVVSWNAIIKLLMTNEQHKQALNAFVRMQIEGELPNHVTLLCATDASSAIASLDSGMRLHIIVRCAGYEYHTVVGTALINMYGRCGCLHNARHIFGILPSQDVVSWTAMIGALVENGFNGEALELFKKMQSQCVLPNDITFICAMEACANLAFLSEGLEIHSLILILCYEHDIQVRNALIDMYCKSGGLELALGVFECMHQRTDVTWNAMIAGFGLHGFGKEALALFWRMQANGVKPDNITYTAVMTACSHVGLIDDAWCLFLHMHDYHGCVHEIDHYVSIIDSLGRAGRLDEAEEVVQKSPFGTAWIAWFCLLAACRLHGDAERGSHAASCCVKLDQTDAMAYKVLLNMYMELGFSELQDL